MMNVYTIDFDRLVTNLQLTFLRKPFLLIFAKCLVSPIVSLYVAFLNFRIDSLYKLNHNSQVVYMQAMLNDSFDNELRRIRIANAVIEQPIWVYEPLDDEPLFVYEASDNAPVYLRELFEFFGGGNDFIVQVPMELKPTPPEALEAYLIKMSAKVDYYKLYSKNYSILFI